MSNRPWIMALLMSPQIGSSLVLQSVKLFSLTHSLHKPCISFPFVAVITEEIFCSDPELSRVNAISLGPCTTRLATARDGRFSNGV